MALDEGDRSIIKLMISDAITSYDLKQEKRHQENLDKFDTIMETISQIKNIQGLVAWGIPLLVALISATIEILRLMHNM